MLLPGLNVRSTSSGSSAFLSGSAPRAADIPKAAKPTNNRESAWRMDSSRNSGLGGQSVDRHELNLLDGVARRVVCPLFGELQIDARLGIVTESSPSRRSGVRIHASR